MMVHLICQGIGVSTQIQKEEPSALYVYCLAHSTNLCL